MSRELTSLLEACKQQPDDDAALGVLADWMEEHGHDRAGLVRLAADGGLSRGRPAFQTGTWAAWKAHVGRWVPFEGDLGQSQSHLRPLPHGGLTLANATRDGLESRLAQRWAGTEEWAWVRRSAALSDLAFLRVYSERWADASLLTALPRAPLALVVSGYGLGDKGLRVLARWPGLARCRVLDVSANEITAAGVRWLAESPYTAGLVGLDLSSNPISPDGVEAALRGPWAATLESLLIADNGCPEPNDELFASVALPRLRECRLGRLMSPAARAALAHVPAVE